MPTIGRTPNFNLALPYGNRQNWTDLVNGNTRVIDALIATYVSVTNLKGLWTNSFAYTAGDNVVDETTGVVYTAQLTHTSSALPTTFLEERTDNPTYWTTFAAAARNRGAWQSNTVYALNDFVLAEGNKYAMCIGANTSGANFAADLALGYWTVILDLSIVGSLVLPILSGAADANKAVISDATGTSYTIASMTALAALLQAAGLAPISSPAFTSNPTAPTQTAEDFGVKLATTEYADRAVRNVVVRTQTFDANGTYTPHAKMFLCCVEAVGSGGGGGGTVSAATGGQAGVGGGGGAGCYVRRWLTVSQIGASKAVVCPAGGAAGGAGNNAGSAGAETSLGALVLAGGGGGGGGNSGVSLNIALGGSGGIAAGTYDFTRTGESGISGVCGVQIANIGIGGSSWFYQGLGQDVITAASAVTGRAGTRGAGGGGGYSANGSANAAGGAGGAGCIIITELCYG